MKAYTVEGKALEGITTSSGHVHVGEPGRGRMVVHVPVPPGATLDDYENMLTLPGPNGAALVLIKDHSGYRGSWTLCAPRANDEWDVIAAHRQNGHAGIASECPECGSRLSRQSPATVRVIAEGRRAQGIAGGMGGGPEYLVLMSDGDAVEIVRRGRLYGAPAVLRVECHSGEVSVTDPLDDAYTRLAANLLKF